MIPVFVSRRGVVLSRLFLGLLQGVALYLLAKAGETKAWPSTDLRAYDALIHIANYLPIFAIVTVGNLRLRTAVPWLAAIFVLCGTLGFYQGYRDPKPDMLGMFASATWFSTTFGLSILLFIGHSLVAAGDADRRRIAAFATYFDVAWRLATQFMLASFFVLLLWGILFLGASLFKAIGITVFFDTIVKAWFSIPVTAMASSAALHLTDAQTGLVRGARNLLLGLLSWLLPLMTAIAVAFLAALPFTGLQVLWKTGFATASLLGAATLLILLINSHFQDGRPETHNSRFLTYTRLPAAFILVPLVVLAAYGLHLRVAQYGWTPSRVIVVALLVVIGCHALGYAITALTSGPALRRLPATNIASAFVTILGILALLTPIADPARISVASQVARLESGAVDPDKFDFNFLRHRSVRFGTEALERLKNKKDGPNATRIADKASRALVPLSPYGAAIDQAAQTPASPQTRRASIVVAANSPPLPDDFLQEDWNVSADKARLPACLTRATPPRKCDGVVADFMTDGSLGVVLLDSSASWMFAKDANGKWTLLGALLNVYCSGVRDRLKAGEIVLRPPRLKDIEVNGTRIPLSTPCAPARR